MKKITPFLWFDGRAEEAANFYTAIFPNSKIVSMMRSGEAGPGPKDRSCPRPSNSRDKSSSH